jgi:hypothetical protein
MLLAILFAWDGPLLPVDNGHVILNKECASEEKLGWSPALQKIAHGLEPGERVWMIFPDAAVPVTLGSATCVAGEECHGAWAALALPSKATRNAIAVVPRRFLSDGDAITAPLQLESKKRACDEPPKLKFPAHECTEWDLGRHPLRLHVQTEMQLDRDTGWEQFRTHVRVAGQSSWQLISEGVEEFTPRAVLLGGESVRVLWRKDEGLGSPARITVQMSRIAADGKHTFGRSYSAGGQPCD